jgi:hypothetical protein
VILDDGRQSIDRRAEERRPLSDIWRQKLYLIFYDMSLLLFSIKGHLSGRTLVKNKSTLVRRIDTNRQIKQI